MPGTSDEMMQWMKAFHEAQYVDDDDATSFLTAKGYTLQPDWTWSKPGVTCLDDMAEEEWKNMLYLVEEWDYGFLTETA